MCRRLIAEGRIKRCGSGTIASPFAYAPKRAIRGCVECPVSRETGTHPLTARLSASDPARTSVTIQLYPKQLPAGEQHLTDHATYL